MSSPNSRFRGLTGYLRLGRRWRVAVALICVLVVGASCTAGDPESQGPSKPNVVLLSLDTTRPDHLPLYGYSRDTAPNLTALAEDAVVFGQAYAAHTNTAPSHASVLTGEYPLAHGVVSNRSRLIEGPITLGEVLREEGYVTGGFVSGATLGRHTGLERGFDVYDADFAEKEEWERRGDLTLATALGWLDQVVLHDQPFFLFLHLYDPHYSYDPPTHLADKFQAVGSTALPELPPDIPGYGWPGMSEAQRDGLVARYDAEIFFADELAGQLLSALESLGVDDDTLIILMSDHGETLFEREWGVDHGANVFDEQIHVALMMRFPRRLGLSGRIPAQVHHVDVLPTILEWLGLEVSARVAGRSLWPVIKGGGSWSAARPVFSHARPEPGRLRRLGAEAQLVKRDLISSIRLPGAKLIEYPTEDGKGYLELYLLRDDPAELNNVADEHSDVVDILAKQLRQWQASFGDAQPLQPAEVSDDVLEALRALGYLD